MSCLPAVVSCICGPRADTEVIRGMHGRSSAKTLYVRYFSAVSTVLGRQNEFFTAVDYVSTVGRAGAGREIIAGWDLPPLHRRDSKFGRGRVPGGGFAARPRARVDPAGAPGAGAQVRGINLVTFAEWRSGAGLAG